MGKQGGGARVSSGTRIRQRLGFLLAEATHEIFNNLVFNPIACGSD
jgi:hypothetical protein